MDSLTSTRTENVSSLQLALFLAGTTFSYFLIISLRDVFFGPMSKFPGPKLWAFTYVPRLIIQALGTESYATDKLHKKYGPVVRIGPRELSFANGGQAWRDIYGHRKKGEPQPSKDKIFYLSPAEKVPSILSASDADHSRVRRIFSPAFAEKALKDQEPMLQRWAGFLHSKLSDHATGIDKLDMQKIFICASFDIMGEHRYEQQATVSMLTFSCLLGELTFSESLNMLHDSKYSSWVDNIFAGVKVATILRSLRQWRPSTRYLVDEVLAKTEGARKQMREHQEYTNERVNRRLQRTPELPDLWTRILAKQDSEGGLSMDEQYSNASLFMMAGADATAMALASTTYYLLRNRNTLGRLTQEIRKEFSSIDEVTMDRAARLPYLQAALQEAMRIHPPNPISLPRTVPKGGMVLCDLYVPENVNVAINHYAHSRREEHFKNPKEYHPERWLGAAEYKDDHLAASQVCLFDGFAQSIVFQD